MRGRHDSNQSQDYKDYLAQKSITPLKEFTESFDLGAKPSVLPKEPPATKISQSDLRDPMSTVMNDYTPDKPLPRVKENLRSSTVIKSNTLDFNMSRDMGPKVLSNPHRYAPAMPNHTRNFSNNGGGVSSLMD